MKKIYSPNSLLEGLDSILLILRFDFPKQDNALINDPGEFDNSENAQLAMLKFLLHCFFDKSINLVQLPGESLIGKASSLRLLSLSNDIDPIAALKGLPETILAASEVELVGS